MFVRLDSSGDRRLGISEFRQAIPTLAKWGVEVLDAEASFNEIDLNGGGVVLFDEFVDWAMSKNLDLEDDGGLGQNNEHANTRTSPDIKTLAKKHNNKLKSPQNSTNKT
mmetsp:Transcript_40251/g.33988  ORF Transcript_40251/g.33988 Transcript_40251/m.33988 type:complete len:109 (+) Transcript_40251:826-1152(+)